MGAMTIVSQGFFVRHKRIVAFHILQSRQFLSFLLPPHIIQCNEMKLTIHESSSAVHLLLGLAVYLSDPIAGDRVRGRWIKFRSWTNVFRIFMQMLHGNSSAKMNKIRSFHMLIEFSRHLLFKNIKSWQHLSAENAFTAFDLCFACRLIRANNVNVFTLSMSNRH